MQTTPASREMPEWPKGPTQADIDQSKRQQPPETTKKLLNAWSDFNDSFCTMTVAAMGASMALMSTNQANANLLTPAALGLASALFVKAAPKFAMWTLFNGLIGTACVYNKKHLDLSHPNAVTPLAAAAVAGFINATWTAGFMQTNAATIAASAGVGAALPLLTAQVFPNGFPVDPITLSTSAVATITAFSFRHKDMAASAFICALPILAHRMVVGNKEHVDFIVNTIAGAIVGGVLGRAYDRTPRGLSINAKVSRIVAGF
jgi:hypothetical protein